MAPEGGPSLGSISQATSESVEKSPVPDMKAERPDKEGHQGKADKMGASPVSRRNKRPSEMSDESEKDSGFSDTNSEYLGVVEHTDTEDRSANGSRRSVKLEWSDKAPATSGAFTSLTPVYILKNVILKQPVNGTQFLQTQMAWSGQHPLDMTQGQARVFLIQQPMTTAAPSLWTARRKQGKNAYLPILKSLPKIAPHPSKDIKSESPSPTALRDSSAGHSKSKRMCMASSKGSLSKHTEATPARKQHERPGKPAQLPPSPCTKSPSPLQQSLGCSEMGIPLPQSTITSLTEPLSRAHPSKSLSASEVSERKAIARVSRKLASNLKQQQRFHNTVDILKKSGLLGITLKTKELIRRNKSTQRDISELKEHTRLLCEAVQSNDSKIWAKLQEAMNLSSCYWDVSGSSAVKQDNVVPADNLPVASPDLSRASSPVSSRNSPMPPSLPADLSVNSSKPEH